MKRSAILLCGGSGKRFGSNKLLAKIDGVEVFIHSLRALLKCVDEENLVVVSSKQDLDIYQETLTKYAYSKVKLTLGGKERYHSVLAGLKTLQDNYLVAVHDAARPYVNPTNIEETFEKAQEHKGAILCKKVSDTIKIQNDDGTKTLKREDLIAAETPQIFYRNDLITAIENVIENKLFVTDDAHAMEYLKKDYYFNSHEGNNKKITYSSDLS